MKRLLFLLLALPMLVGCTPKLFREMGMRPVAGMSLHRSTLFPAFDNVSDPVFFTAKIDRKETSIEGILAMSKDSASMSYRMVMMTAFGMPLLDFSLSRDSFVVNSCMEQLDKKSVLGLFEKDFRSILMLNVPNDFTATTYGTVKKTNKIGYNFMATDGEMSILIYPHGLDFARVMSNGRGLKRMNAVFDSELITIEHPKLKLKISLKRMNQE